MASRVSRYCFSIAKRHIVAGLALLHLGHSVCADRSLNRVLNIGDVDAPARGRVAVNGEIQIGLSDDAKDAKIVDALAPSPSAPESRSAVRSSVRRSSP